MAPPKNGPGYRPEGKKTVVESDTLVSELLSTVLMMANTVNSLTERVRKLEEDNAELDRRLRAWTSDVNLLKKEINPEFDFEDTDEYADPEEDE